MAEKLQFIPLIEVFIEAASRSNGERLGFIRYDAQEKLFEPAIRFKLHLSGNQLRLFNESWEKFYRTTREEVYVAQHNDTQEQKDKMQHMLLSRLEALRKSVQES